MCVCVCVCVCMYKDDAVLPGHQRRNLHIHSQKLKYNISDHSYS